MNKQALVNSLARSIERLNDELPEHAHEQAAELICQKIIAWGLSNHWNEIKNQVGQLQDKKHGVLPLTITSAREMKPALRSRLEESITHELGQKLRPTYVVNPAIIGGVSVQSDTLSINATVHDILAGI